MKDKPTLVFWSAISLLVIVNLMVFDFAVLASPPELRVQFTPDDTFYYLQLAKNFADLGYWSFDSGVSVASGFHPLLAYMLAVIYAVFRPSTEQFVTVGILLSAIPALLLVIIVWLKSIRSRNIPFLIAIALFAGAQSFLFNSVSGVESAFVISLAALYCFVFAHAGSSTHAAWKLFAVGLLLSLARSDAGLLPLSVFSIAVLVRIIGNESSRTALRNSFAGLAGACVGVGLVFLNNYLFTGTILQSSARMKMYWGEFQDHLFIRSMIIAARTAGADLYFLSFPTLCFSILVFLVIFSVLLLLSRGRKLITSLRQGLIKERELNTQIVLYAACCIALVAYLLLYTNGGGGLQNWYTANFLVPMFLVFAGLIGFLLAETLLRARIVEVTLSLIVLITILINIRSVYPLSQGAPWPHQQAMLAAGKYLSARHFDGKIGSWNAGIIGYYQGGQIVNIDGLVNESIYAFAVRNRLPVYLREKNILYVVDFETMLIPVYRRRGGYDDPAFLEKLVPIIQFDEGQFPEWNYLTLYRIED